MAETADIVCASCGAQLQDRTAFCPACGAAAPGMGSTGAGDGEIAALLAAASRALKRRDWATAREKCTEAIAREHDNRSALALMGDICMEQHRYEDAASWYQLALDQDSENVSVEHKLTRARALARVHPATAADGAKEPGIWRARLVAAQARAEEFVRASSFQKYLALLTIILGAIMFIAILTAAYVRRSDGGAPEVLPTYTPQQSGASGSPPQPSGPPAQISPKGTRTEPKKAAGPSTTALPGAIPQESALLSNLRTNPIVSESGAEIQALWADQRDKSITLVIGARPSSTRKTVLLQAKESASAAFALEPMAERAVVRVNRQLADYTGGTSLNVAFMGDITREKAIQALPPTAPDNQIEALFTRVYWDPSLRVAPQGALPLPAGNP